MTTSATVPVTVTAEAAARITELGIKAAVDQMIAFACQNLPELVRIEVVLYDRYELGDEPGLAIDVYSKRPFDPADRPMKPFDRWLATVFPPEVLQHVLVDYHPGDPHAG